MKNKILQKKALHIGISWCLLIGLSISLSSCKKQDEKPKPEEVRLVKTIVLEQTAGGYTHTYPGTVIANKRVELAFQVAGPLIEFPVVNGQQVEKGEVLARIDPRDFKNKYDAESSLLLKYRQQYLRAKELVKSGTIAVSTFDEAKSDYDVSVARTETAKKAYEDTFLRAPFSGLIAETYVENFQNVKAKEHILSLQDISRVDINIDLPEQDLVYTKRKERRDESGEKFDVFVTFGAVPSKKFDVSLKEYATQADPVTQTYKITVTMPAPEAINILPGMTATLTLIKRGRSDRQEFLVPVEALVTDAQGKSYVWLVNESEEKVFKRYVHAGELRLDKLLITEGLKIGDRIVIAGVNSLSEGMEVRLQTGKKLVR